MKNLLRSTLYLTVFALAGILFQISCSNSNNQNLSTNSSPIGKLVYYKIQYTGSSVTTGAYTCNYDGTNETPINITLPAGMNIKSNANQTHIRLSPDGQKVFFVTVDSAGIDYIYSCNITGGTATQVMSLNSQGNIEIGGAY
jgi:Tol biopolymer transport system component